MIFQNLSVGNFFTKSHEFLLTHSALYYIEKILLQKETKNLSLNGHIVNIRTILESKLGF